MCLFFFPGFPFILINKVKEHKETPLIRFDTHRDLCQSEENECIWTHYKDGAMCTGIMFECKCTSVLLKTIFLTEWIQIMEVV